MARCDKCGFLTVETLDEVGLDARTTGRIRGKAFRENDLLDGPILDKPVCFMQAVDLRKELNITANTSTEAMILSLITKERDCKPLTQFRQWQMGFSPKEHREMMDREQLLRWQAEREESDRRWHRNMKILELSALIIGAGLFTIIGAFIQKWH